jgi:deazaflavin-dependent oxidoreductase (nitroreductase family)
VTAIRDDDEAPRADAGGMEPSTATHPASKPAPRAPSLMHRISVATMSLARPLAGRRIFPLWAVLEHRGRTTGTVRRTPVVALRAEGGFIIPVPFGPSTQWTQNVLAAGGASLTWKGRDWQVGDPRVVGFDEAAGPLGPMGPIAKRAGIETYLRVRDA